MSALIIQNPPKRKKPWFSKLRRLWLPITIVAAVLLVGVGVAGYVVYKQKTPPKAAPQAAPQNEALQSAINSLNETSIDKDVKTDIAGLEEKAKTATTKDEKVQAYSDLSAAYSKTGNYNAAIDAVNKRNEADPENAKYQAYTLAHMYELAGDKQRAIAQYKISLDMTVQAKNSTPGTDENDPFHGYDARIQELQMSIDRLEGKPLNLPI